MRLLRTLHAYAGLVLGVLLAMYAVTGAVLLFKDEIWQLQYPELRAEAPPAGASDHAAALAGIGEALDGRYSTVMLPRAGLAAYHVYTPAGEALFAAGSGAEIARWGHFASFTAILTELHFHLAAGEAGKNIGGIIALLAVAMAISGVILWWPAKRSFRLASLRPASGRRGALLSLHRDLGVLSAALLLLFSITALGIIFSSATRAVLNTLLSTEASAVIATQTGLRPASQSTPTAAQIAAAQSRFPDARLVAWYAPQASRPYHYFRFRQPGEVHPNGRSRVHVSLDSPAILQSVDATLEPRGERAWYWFYPLHAGKVGGWPYLLLTLISAAAIAVLGISGILAFLKRRRTQPRAFS